MDEGELPLEPSDAPEGASAVEGADETDAVEVDAVAGQADETGERWEPL